MKDYIKFEYVFAILVIVILAIALFVFKGDKDTTSMIMTSLVGALSAITAFFFTKTQVGKDGNGKSEKDSGDSKGKDE
ncbi:hypothetical protein [Clostridium sp. JNZ J1-5]